MEQMCVSLGTGAWPLSDLFVDYFGPNHFTITLNQFHLIIFLPVKIIVQQSNLYQSLDGET